MKAKNTMLAIADHKLQEENEPNVIDETEIE